jgi:L-fucose isomerase
MFGVDTEHIDQLEIIRRAEGISEDRTSQMVSWLGQNVDDIAYDQKGLIPDKLAFQVRCYLATKEIIREMGLDFVAIKCMPDLSTHYVPQCMTAAFLPSPYDAEGTKETTAMACEADADAALTLEILKHLSGGSPVLFGDVSHINYKTHTLYIPNCGGMCTWFARRSNNASENLKCVQIRPAMRPGGGGITYFACAPGPITLARLYRKAGEYRMAILPGEGVELSQEDYEEFVKARGRHQLPTAFVKVSVDLDRFIEEFASNHICAVAGIHVHELEQFCRILHIQPVVMDR